VGIETVTGWTVRGSKICSVVRSKISVGIVPGTG
jgi:hypothetical protein